MLERHLIRSPTAPAPIGALRDHQPRPRAGTRREPRAAGPRGLRAPSGRFQTPPPPRPRRGPRTGPRGLLRAPSGRFPTPGGAPSAQTAVPGIRSPGATPRGARSRFHRGRRLRGVPRGAGARRARNAELEERAARQSSKRRARERARDEAQRRARIRAHEGRRRAEDAETRANIAEARAEDAETRAAALTSTAIESERSARRTTPIAADVSRRADAAGCYARTPPSNAPSPRFGKDAGVVARAGMLRVSAVLCDKKQARDFMRAARRVDVVGAEEGDDAISRRVRTVDGARSVGSSAEAALAAAAEDGRSTEDVIAEAMEAIKISLDSAAKERQNGGDGRTPSGLGSGTGSGQGIASSPSASPRGTGMGSGTGIGRSPRSPASPGGGAATDGRDPSTMDASELRGSSSDCVGTRFDCSKNARMRFAERWSLRTPRIARGRSATNSRGSRARARTRRRRRGRRRRRSFASFAARCVDFDRMPRICEKGEPRALPRTVREQRCPAPRSGDGPLREDGSQARV